MDNLQEVETTKIDKRSKVYRDSVSSKATENNSNFIKPEEIKFFGEIDMNKNGQIGSEYPHWYNEEKLNSMQDQLDFEKSQLDAGYYPPDRIMEVRQKISNLEKKIDMIRTSRPKLEGSNKDLVAKAKNETADMIKEILPSYSDMQRGIADSNAESDRQLNPRIKLKTEEQLKLANMCNVKVTDGKVTEIGLHKMWKMASKALGEEHSNIEHLRRG